MKNKNKEKVHYDQNCTLDTQCEKYMNCQMGYCKCDIGGERPYWDGHNCSKNLKTNIFLNLLHLFCFE
jgi:hypothetical protein